MELETLKEFLNQLDYKNYKMVKIADRGSFPKSIKQRLITAKNVYNVIKSLQRQNWTIEKQTDNEVILVGLFEEGLICVYVKITYSHIAQNHEAEEVKICYRSIRL